MQPRPSWSLIHEPDPAQARLAPTQHENKQHDYHDDDYRPDTDIHWVFLSWQRPVSIADEVPGAIFEIGFSSATRTGNLKRRTQRCFC
jgi:hypothetical protein